MENFQLTKTDFSYQSLDIPTNFFFFTIQIKQIFCYSSSDLGILSYKKFHLNFFYKPNQYITNVSLHIYQKLHLYYLQSSFQKQQFNLFSNEFFLFKFLDSINNTSSIPTIQNPQKLNNLLLVSNYSEKKWTQKNKLLLEKPQISVESFFEDFLVNNYWFECYEKKLVKNLITFTGETWFKHHFILKKKLLFNLKFNPNNSRFLNYTNQLNSFFKEKLIFNESFLPTSNLKPSSKKLVMDVMNLFLFEFHQKIYKIKNNSYTNKIFEFEKSFFNIHCLKLNFLFQAIPIFLNNIFMLTVHSLDFLPKKNLFLKSVKKTKLQFFSFKQFLNKYYCFYFNQRVSVGSSFIVIHFPSIKLLSNSYCQPFNSLDQGFLKFLKKMPCTSLSKFSINLDYQVYTQLNLKSSKHSFVLTIPKQKLNIIHNNIFISFLKIFKFITFHNIFMLRNASSKQLNGFEVCFSFQNYNKCQLIFELETILFNLVKKLTFYCSYLKTSNEFRNTGNKKKCRLLNQWIALGIKNILFLNFRKLLVPFLWNKSNSLFNNLFFSVKNKQLVIFIQNPSSKLKAPQFLSIFNNWLLYNYPQLQPMRMSKQKIWHIFQKEKLFNNLNLSNLTRGLNHDLALQKLNVYHSESFISLLSSTGLHFVLPNELNVVQHLNLLKKSIKFSATQTQELLMKNLNSKIYAWCYFYRFTNKNEIFYSLDTQLLKWLWRWACRRHNNKSKKWIKVKYFYKFNQKNWVFGTIVLDNFLKSSSQLTKPNSLALPLFSYFPFHSQIFWNLKKARN